jgi:hypothetical protein
MTEAAPTDAVPRSAQRWLIEGVVSAILATAVWEAGRFILQYFLRVRNLELSLPLWVYLPYPLVVIVLMSFVAKGIVQDWAILGDKSDGKFGVVTTTMRLLTIVVIPLVSVAAYIYGTQQFIYEQPATERAQRPICSTSKVGGLWDIRATNMQQKLFSVEFDATPHGGVDEVFALSQGKSQAYDNYSCLIRFYPDNRIQMWSGEGPPDPNGLYDVDNAFAYRPDVRYHFRISANVKAQKCSAYVSTGTEPEHFLGAYKFRKEASVLDEFGVHMDAPVINQAQSPEQLTVEFCDVRFLPF